MNPNQKIPTQRPLASSVVARVVEKLRLDRESITKGLLGSDGKIGKRFPLEKRFRDKVGIRGPDECWPWLGATNKKGYGNFTLDDENGKAGIEAHRLSWIIHNGPIFSDGSHHGPCVCHNCPTQDNPSCVNPSHLFLGSQKKNIHDMDFKGGRRERSRLSYDNVIEILTSQKSIAGLATKFHAPYGVVWSCRNRRSWKWVEIDKIQCLTT